MITLVLGGARSGKSDVAERLLGDDAAVTYIATVVVQGDADLARRVETHQARRPSSWSTVECAGDLSEALLSTTGPVLVDSLGPWVAAAHRFEVDATALVAALRHRSGDTVVVSEEVGLGVHPSTEMGRRFRDALGDVNRAVADVADRVLLVVAGRVVEL